MYPTRKSARRVTMDVSSVDTGAYNLDHDDVYDASPPRSEASRGRRRGHSVLHAVKEPPRSVRLRRNSSGHDGSNPSYLELDSDDDSYDIDQLCNSRDIKQSSRLISKVPMTLKEVSSQAKKLESSELASGGRLTRSSRGRASDCNEYETNQKRTRVEQKIAAAPTDKRQRVTDAATKRIEQQEVINEEDDEDRDEEEDEEEEEEEEISGRKYSLRDRDSSRRETMNISVLGGDGGGCARGRGQGATRSLRSGEHMISAPLPRLYLGPKNPHFSHGRYRRSGSRSGKHDHHHHKSHTDGARRHYDSSSDSSCDDRSNNRRDGRNGGRHGDQIGGGSEDAQFNTYETERLQAERDSIQPLTMGSLGAGGGDMGMGGSLRDKASQRDMLRADAAPVAVDPKLGFQSIGGLEKHVQALKEMVVLPLLYPDVFQRFDTQPPRGVLFVGPPGTGKTLTARALANSVTINAAQGGRKVSFFMRKGADCLSKWVGEGERQLRLLFEQAKRYQPSIIFFDEIDGLAPVRSVKQDQIHASIVSTLLALMDGLDARGQVVVIGATNRPDAIDPALRRPGRFDRELYFPLPDARARAAIIDINTGSWNPPVPRPLKDWLVSNTSGYCGADLKALCAEAALVSLRRAYPQVYESTTRLDLDPNRLILGKGDFAAALNKVIPASRRGVSGTPARPLDSISANLLKTQLKAIMLKIRSVLPAHGVQAGASHIIASTTHVDTSILESETPLSEADMLSVRVARITQRVQKERLALENIPSNSEAWIAALTDMQDMESPKVPDDDQYESDDDQYKIDNSVMWDAASITSYPRLVIVGSPGMGQNDLAAAAIQQLEGMPCFAIDLPALLADLNAHSPEQALVNRVQEAFKVSPSVIYLPSLTSWWDAAQENMKSALITLIEAMPSSLPVLWLTTLTVDVNAVKEDSTNTEEKRLCFSVEDNRLAKLITWFGGIVKHTDDDNSAKGHHYVHLNGFAPNAIFLEGPSDNDRRRVFASYFSTLHLLPNKLYEARMQVIKAKIQIHKPCLPKIEKPTTVEQSTSSSPHGSRNKSLRSGLSCKNQGGKDSALRQQHQPMLMTEDNDKQCVRELRNFLRATLGELHKEKKCLVFWRPVDPENVPDYYDVISCPMDLETMRMKVDNSEYPTLSHFLRDIEQIVFNAKEYNPLTLKDVRGRSIVHAAHSMGDIVESHAYNFKKEIGYDLFTQCEEIAEKLHLYRSPSPRVGDKMTELDAKYYAEILHVHQQVKDEEGEEHPTALKLLALEIQNESNALALQQEQEQVQEQEQEGVARCPSEQSSVDDTRDEKLRDFCTGIVGESDESQSLEDGSADVTVTAVATAAATASATATATASASSSRSADVEAAEMKELVEEENQLVKEEIEKTDITCLPIMQSLDKALSVKPNMFDHLLKDMVNQTSKCSVAEIVTITTGLHRLTREFQTHCNWNAFMTNLEHYSSSIGNLYIRR